jgi:hypothetical protein
LIFIGEDGRVRDILAGEPFSEALISPSEPAEKTGINDGDLVRHPVINAAPGANDPG